MTFKIINWKKINFYEKWVPLTTVKMVHWGPKKRGSVKITTPVWYRLLTPPKNKGQHILYVS